MTIDTTTVEFLERLNRDASLQAELETAIAAAASDKTGAVVSLAASKGFTIDRDGFDEARALLLGAAAGSHTLGDDELDAVAGGFNPQPDPPGRISNLAQQVTFSPKTLLSW